MIMCWMKIMCVNFLSQVTTRIYLTQQMPSGLPNRPFSSFLFLFFLSTLSLCYLGDELECIQPSLYRNVARQLNISVAMENMVSDAFIGVATEIFSTGTVTWLALDLKVLVIMYHAVCDPRSVLLETKLKCSLQPAQEVFNTSVVSLGLLMKAVTVINRVFLCGFPSGPFGC